MANIQCIIRVSPRLKRIQRKYRKQGGTYRTTYLAKVSGSVRGTKPGHLWVHDATGTDSNGNTTYGGSYQLPIRVGATISLRPDLKVDVITRPGGDYIDGMNFTETVRVGLDPHQFNAADPSRKYTLVEHLSNLQSFPDGGTATVRVMPSIYRRSNGVFAVFSGQTGINIITGLTPATDMQVVVCTWLDESTNTIITTGSSEVSRDTDLALNPSTAMTLINECAVSAPAGAIGATAYIIFDDTTTISATNKFHDLRGIVGNGGAAASGAISGVPMVVSKNWRLASPLQATLNGTMTINSGFNVTIEAGAQLRIEPTDPVRNRKVVTTDYTIKPTDYFVDVDASAFPITITMPPLADNQSVPQVYIGKADSGGFAVTITGNGSDTLDSSATQVLIAQNDTITCIKQTESNWRIA